MFAVILFVQNGTLFRFFFGGFVLHRETMMRRGRTRYPSLRISVVYFCNKLRIPSSKSLSVNEAKFLCPHKPSSFFSSANHCLFICHFSIGFDIRFHPVSFASNASNVKETLVPENLHRLLHSTMLTCSLAYWQKVAEAPLAKCLDKIYEREECDI